MSEAGAALSKEDVITIEGMFNTVEQRISAGEWSAWAAMYSEDAILHPPHQPAVRGRANIEKWGYAFPPVEALEFSDVHVGGEGNFAYGTSAYSLTLKGLPPDKGKQLVVCRRTTDGWKVVAVSFNSDLPLPGQA